MSTKSSGKRNKNRIIYSTYTLENNTCNHIVKLYSGVYGRYPLFLQSYKSQYTVFLLKKIIFE
jgi:hypothetical protein